MKKNVPSAPAIGVIGGSGLYEMEGLARVRRVRVTTPFGAPSDEYLEGWLDGRRVVFLPRHGRGHRILPSEINFRANVFGMKKLGVNRILSLSAVGSMRESIRPGDFVVVDQFFDRTRHRHDTFFGRGIAAHVMFADPVCPELGDCLAAASEGMELRLHRGGTYLCMEGPQFSTRAESRAYRQWGVDVIGMTNLQEAKLAREAEICYSTVAMATDYDCWHETEEDVSVEAVLAVMAANVGRAKELLRRTIPRVPDKAACSCQSALATAILTDRKAISKVQFRKLAPILGKYSPGSD